MVGSKTENYSKQYERKNTISVCVHKLNKMSENNVTYL